MPPLRPSAALIVLGAFFIALGAAVAMIGVLPADAAVREALLSWATPAIVGLMRIVNRAGDWRLLLPGTLLLLAVFRRARPEGVAFGFPSGHATAAAAFFGAVLYLAGSLPPARRRAVRALAVASIVLVGCARVILRAHWPSDVLGGITLGLALATIAALFNSLDGEVANSFWAGRGRARKGS